MNKELRCSILIALIAELKIPLGEQDLSSWRCLAFAHESSRSDSGRQSNVHRMLMHIIKIITTGTTDGSIAAPIGGPTKIAIEKLARIKPNAAARSFGGIKSEMYASDGAMLDIDPVNAWTTYIQNNGKIPFILRKTMMIGRIDNPWAITRTGFRPCLSLQAPRAGATMMEKHVF
jgi:hypothetical protein